MPERVAVWKREMSAEENAEFENAAGYLLDDLGYETATPKSELDAARGVGALEVAHAIAAPTKPDRPDSAIWSSAASPVRTALLRGSLS